MGDCSLVPVPQGFDGETEQDSDCYCGLVGASFFHLLLVVDSGRSVYLQIYWTGREGMWIQLLRGAVLSDTHISTVNLVILFRLQFFFSFVNISVRNIEHDCKKK